ncbi:apolipoprotein L3-like isoform X2 [Meles meles]|uniref:apolipoprotein L3-like isoform X2 n=1 Tax=Meles meles TaxID=9662 RepID=UPI001E69F645|nr:apolipoprotein L3-like isoform X2 [Meles meles]XP_045867563.1 apolipoprotein L3-like isoform X2 [Meles meles]XP_045867564.1 apolipoprotein L3-like isoform X2 [Meles meles]XP_045867565.1 apolipoprotein L3-like isoform X2 [Meles meles]XP_045867566.1 apolipoprotein L3-like isoform X2 [Meles meles]XP_045867567.1 apolipoprotein L3-like isoform X2 [Meles meles]XP_045867568.1 apolipoprotein L3-like isoform X2 [Meles meles]XP_045867569.1 apolipoprotein L3-like isoform X3 [Meles meles]XP_04586757
MTSGARGLSPESESLLEEVIETFRNTVRCEDLYLLLSDHESWERFVAEATLSREEAEALREGLNELQRTMDLEAEDQQARESFLHKFPELKLKIEERIRKLHELADEVDRVHWDCTIANVVAGSAGVVSGLLSILGLGLAPVTAGASLALLATGIGLGAAATVTQVSTSIVEDSSELSAKAQASHLTSTDFEKQEVVAKVLRDRIPQIYSLTDKCFRALQNIAKNIRAIKLAKVKPRLVVNSRCLMTAQRVSVRGGQQVQKAFGGTALAMTKQAWIMGVATAGLSLAMDVVNLVKDSGHLQKGAKTESAEGMRWQARELECKLEKLTEIYESLKEGPTP